MAGTVIQAATGRTYFEDSLWIRNQYEVRNGFQIACTIPKVNFFGPPMSGRFQGDNFGQGISMGRRNSNLLNYV